MHPSNDLQKESPKPENEKPKSSEKAKSDQQRSDPPLTEIKGVTDPEEYVEPKVEEEPKK